MSASFLRSVAFLSIWACLASDASGLRGASFATRAYDVWIVVVALATVSFAVALFLRKTVSLVLRELEVDAQRLRDMRSDADARRAAGDARDQRHAGQHVLHPARPCAAGKK